MILRHDGREPKCSSPSLLCLHSPPNTSCAGAEQLHPDGGKLEQAPGQLKFHIGDPGVWGSGRTPTTTHSGCRKSRDGGYTKHRAFSQAPSWRIPGWASFSLHLYWPRHLRQLRILKQGSENQSQMCNGFWTKTNLSAKTNKFKNKLQFTLLHQSMSCFLSSCGVQTLDSFVVSMDSSSTVTDTFIYTHTHTHTMFGKALWSYKFMGQPSAYVFLQ